MNGTLLRRILPLSAALLALVFPAPPAAGEKPKKEAEKAALTDEEKEMLKDREMLENLDLLLALDKFECFELFIEKNSGGEKEEKATQPEPKKSEKKK